MKDNQIKCIKQMEKDSYTSANRSQETNPKSDKNPEPIGIQRAALIVHPGTCDGASIHTSVEYTFQGHTITIKNTFTPDVRNLNRKDCSPPLNRSDAQNMRGQANVGYQDQKNKHQEFDEIVKNIISLFKRWLNEKHKNGNITSATLSSNIQGCKKSKSLLLKISQHSDLSSAFQSFLAHSAVEYINSSSIEDKISHLSALKNIRKIVFQGRGMEKQHEPCENHQQKISTKEEQEYEESDPKEKEGIIIITTTTSCPDKYVIESQGQFSREIVPNQMKKLY